MNVRAWHPGQLFIAWILLAIAETVIIAGYFGLIGLVGHNDWPRKDQIVCLRSGPVTHAPVRALYSLDTVALTPPGVSLEELSQQLGLGVPDTATFLERGGKFLTPTARTDTARMIQDISRFLTFKDSVDTLIQNTYFASRGLRLDRRCMDARYAAADQRIRILNWTTAILLLALPLIGLRMTWVWFGARSKRL